MMIFISGCAKTRTTLVQWLFSAFKNCVVFPGELHVNTFRLSNLREHDKYHMVIKRTINSVFSHRLTRDDYADQISRISMDGIKVVRVVRNKEDTLRSENGYVTPQRYIDCEHQAEDLKALINVEIDSDELLENPDGVQKKVADKLGLEIEYPWSSWPDFAPKRQMIYIKYHKIFNRIGKHDY